MAAALGSGKAYAQQLLAKQFKGAAWWRWRFGLAHRHAARLVLPQS